MRFEVQTEIPAGIKSDDKVAANTRQFEQTEQTEQTASNLYADAYADLRVTKTADRSSLDRCDLGLAEDAAKALDDNRRPDASRLLSDCLDQSSGFISVSPDYQKFAESISAAEVKGKGLDLTLKYGLGRYMAFYFESAEIK